MMTMTLHFSDVDPVATCKVKQCNWHAHGDSMNDAVTAWTKHLTVAHRGDWDDGA